MTPRWPWIVVAIFCPLVSTTADSAECAWVLWEKWGGDMPWETTRAVMSREECEADRKWYVDEDKKKGLPILRQCLPDTVDPRGPKGQ